MIKIDLVTGFLGSGKTTFIRKYAAHLMNLGLKIAILENDYGAVNIDMLLLKELEEAGCELEMIAGGCDYDCHVRRFRTKLISMAMRGFDRVIVEPSGIFDADEFFDLLHEDPVDRWYEAGSVIGIVDAGLPDEMSRESDYFLVSQIANAGVVVMSRTQEYPAGRRAATIGHINRALGEFQCDRVLSKADVITKNWDQFEDSDFEKMMNAGICPADHLKLRILDENGFSTLYFLNIPLPLNELERIAEELFSDEGRYGRVIRMKGFHQENGTWYEMNAAHSERTIKECAGGQEVFLVIGEKLEQNAIADRVIPEEMREKVWHNGQVYNGSDQDR